ncbi:MAG: glycoside hydrolase family 3 C-terminal domain-containing protein [Halanaerobiales bacterium]
MAESNTQNRYPFNNPELDIDTRIEDLISRLTPEEKIGFIPSEQEAVDRLGIKEYSVGGEAAHGWVSREGDEATVFPQTIGLACTWNTDLMKEIGAAIGDEARAYYNEKGRGLIRWAPTVDMERDPRWGRTEEAYGEDPYLTGEMASALVQGMQGYHPRYLKMAATLKHFFANNNEAERCSCSISIDPRNMREYYWRPFRTAIKEGRACCLMTAYNAVNGTPCILNKDVRRVVKEKWALPGFVVGDAQDFSQIVTDHNYYSSHVLSIAEALKNGIDCIPDDVKLIKEALRSALKQELISEADIDRALKNIFRVRFRLGEFDPEVNNPYTEIDRKAICCDAHRELALKSARQSLVLLKNEDNLLPLNEKKIEKIAVIGPLADEVYRDWYTGVLPYRVSPLQAIKNKLGKTGVEVKFADGRDRVAFRSQANDRYLHPDIKEGNLISVTGKQIGKNEVFELTDWGWGRFTLKSEASGKYLTTDQKITASAEEVYGWYVKELYNLLPQDDGSYVIRTWNNKTVTVGDKGLKPGKNGLGDQLTDSEKFKKVIVERGVEEAAAAAREADIALVFVGNHPLINGKEEVDREDIILPDSQRELIKSVYEANPATVLVLISSYPVAINRADENIPAIIYSSHGGQEIGTAIADVLFGDYNPAGRLNMTWYKSVKQLPDIMDYDIIKGKRTYMYFAGEPLYPFGHGLTYTRFLYSDLKLSAGKINSEETVKISLKIKNMGSRNSDEVVQLYVKSLESTVTRPQKELKGFDRINLDPGECKEVSFLLTAEDLEFWDVSREKYIVESGSYKIMIGRSSRDIRLDTVLEIEGEDIFPRNLSKVTAAQNYDDYRGITLGEIRDKGETCVKFSGSQDWILFRNVDFGEGVNRMEVRAVNQSGAEVLLEARLDCPQGDRFVCCPITEDKLSSYKCQFKTIDGIHDVYIAASGQLTLTTVRIFKEDLI